MASKWILAWGSLALAGCVGPGAVTPPLPTAVQVIAFNDFHGNLEPPRQALTVSDGAGGSVRVPAGGAAYLAGAINQLRTANPNHVVVSAGDMIGASPLVSALFLDEPTIAAMNLIRVDYNAVGNHEFDRGWRELLRMQHGGCDRFVPAREPCQVDRDFAGASFRFLAANTITEGGTPLLPAYGIRRFGTGTSEVAVGFIGMTLRGTPAAVTPAGVAGLTFRDEAETANALIPVLRREGADAIVILIHQGGATDGANFPNGCDGLGGELIEILDRLDPAIDLVVSGHTHQAYVCDYGRINAARPFLVTSAGQYGTLVTDIRLTIDPVAGRVVSREARNIVVQSETFQRGADSIAASDRLPRFEPDAAISALVARYADAARDRGNRVVGSMAGAASRAPSPAGETVAGNFIVDAQLAATRGADAGHAEIAFMNPGGVRADIVPAADGSVTFGALFAAQPFGNNLVVKSLTGRQIRTLLEQQFEGDYHRVLAVSQGFAFSYDLSRAVGQRIVAVTLNGQPLDDDRAYRVTMNNFLSSGGDRFTIFAQGTDPVGGVQDLEALESYLVANPGIAPPALGRVTNLTPQTAAPR